METSNRRIISAVVLADASASGPIECLKTLAAQTIATQLEVVLVLRASSQRQLPAFRDQFAAVRSLVVDSSASAGAMKNLGVQAASGEWIAFIGAEDTVAPNYLERLRASAEANDASVAVSDIAWQDRDMCSFYPLTTDNLYLLACPDAPDTGVVDASIVIGSVDGASIFGKLFKREVCLRYPFEETPDNGEDASAILPILVTVKRVAYVSGIFYKQTRCRSAVDKLPRIQTSFNIAENLLIAISRISKIDVRIRDLAVAVHLLPALADLLSLGEALAYQARLTQILNQMSPPTFLAALDVQNPFLPLLYTHGAGWERRVVQRLFKWLSLPGSRRDLNQLYSLNDFHPLVSIIIPVYNGANYMREAIKSALRQTYDNVEVLVINDGSTDGGETAKIAHSYGSRIRYIEKSNGGVATALNSGIAQMRGEYFSWLSHDDMYLPRKIENQVRQLHLLENRKTLLLEGCRLMDACGRILCTVNPRNQYHEKSLRNPLFPLLRGAVNGCALMIHKSHFDRVGYFDPGLPTTQDYDLWFRMFRGQPMFCSGDSNTLNRVHLQQGSLSYQNHFQECDHLWIRMMDDVTKAEQITMDGNSEQFYVNLYHFLANCCPNYHRAVSHAASLAGIAATPAAPNTKEPGFNLCRSRSWLLFKPLRAFQYTRNPNTGGLANRPTLFWRYLHTSALDRKSDEVIRSRKCWRLTEPLRKVGALLRKARPK
ncbi:MAG: glycosyltransferase family 2 protein [Candidatus Limiplasma sp.]|nr:glycosyltransferase family 2 protein [Candidatus Limiplasma sp.]